MYIKRCANGHFYDAEKNIRCPFCSVQNDAVTDKIHAKFSRRGQASLIGHGSTGWVYRISGKRDFALKIIECGADSNKYQNALYELDIMKKLSGLPHVVQICESDILDENDEKTVYILEEYLIPLSEYLLREPFTAAEVVNITMDVCEALIECRNAGVAHLDVQPKNIFVDNAGTIKIGDFSASLFIEDLIRNRVMRGTLAFMAPEVYREKRCSEQSDIYSVGIILYSLFNEKKLPFMDCDNKDTAIYKRLAGTPLPDITYPEKTIESELRKIIRDACEYEPDKRIQSIETLKDRLTVLYEYARKTGGAEIVLKSGKMICSSVPGKQIVPVIYVIQTPENICGKAVMELNDMIQKTMRIFKNAYANIDNAEIRISILEYGNDIKWKLVNADVWDTLDWQNFIGGGTPQLGCALKELNSKLTIQEEGILSPRCFEPIIFFISDGSAGDEYKRSLEILKTNKWYLWAVKAAFMTDVNGNKKVLTEIVGSEDAIYPAKKAAYFVRHKIIYLMGQAFEDEITMPVLFDADSLATSIMLFDSCSSTPSGAPPAPAFPSKDYSSAPLAPPPASAPAFPLKDWAPIKEKTPAKSRRFFRHRFFKKKKIPKRQSAAASPCRVCGKLITIHDAMFCPYCGIKTAIENKSVDMSRVQFSAIAPKEFVKGDYTIIDILMYEESFRYVVDELLNEARGSAGEKKSGILKVAESSKIKICLASQDFVIEDNEEVQEWNGDYLKFSFAVTLPEKYEKRQVLFIASVFVNDVIAVKLKFTVKCFSFLKQRVSMSRLDILSAFMSYASQDRRRVAAIVQGMRKARPDMDIFFDVETLRSGENWEKALYDEIEKRDVLFLCWSHYACQSKWVDAEWRYALNHKGIDCIEPIPIEAPDICPPPKELKHKHFNDRLLYIINTVNVHSDGENKLFGQTEDINNF